MADTDIDAVEGPHEGYHLAQVNIGRTTGPLDAPHMADFTDNLAHINGLGKVSPGFVWLLEGADTEAGATDIAWPGDPAMLVNMSVWESVATLRDFVFATEHRPIMARRREFFERPTEAIAVLWWIPAGTTPTVQDAKERLDHFREHGPTPYGFSFSKLFAPSELEDLALRD